MTTTDERHELDPVLAVEFALDDCANAYNDLQAENAALWSFVREAKVVIAQECLCDQGPLMEAMNTLAPYEATS